MTLPQLLAETVNRHPQKTAFIGADGKKLTFSEYWAAANRMANALQDRGVEKGDTIGIYAPNSVEYAVVLHGALIAGATVTTLNPLYREREVEHQLGDAGAKAVFTLNPLVPVAKDAQANLPHLKDILELENTWDMVKSAGDPKPVEYDPDTTIAVLPFSSGTTGLPKGVMLSHQNLTANIRQTLAMNMFDDKSIILDFLPFYHIYGMMVLLNCGMAVGATQIVLPRFDPETALRLIQEHRVTDLFVVPPALLALVNFPGLDQADTSSLRFVMSGAAPLPAEVGRQAAAKFNAIVMQGYGMTEASPITNVNPLDGAREGTVGPPVADTLEKVVSLDTGDDVGPGEVGELLVSGPQVMKGYWNNPEATAETITPDGWLRTGDIVTADPDGFIRIHDRKKEMIKYKGYQIAPAELESLLMEHPGVRDAAVIPKREGEAGDEVPKAFVVATEPGLDTDSVLTFVAEKVAPYKKIRYIEVVEAIPKNPSGKILRRQLIEEERSRNA
jgi:acyl-CoA synthetase (AMP-forming)/AMP-acid ligase II